MRIHRNPLIWAAVATCGIATALPIALAQKPEAPAEPEKSEPGAAAENPAADQQAWLGVAVDELHPEAGVQLGVPEGVGLSVHAVVPNSPADEAGIEERDLLTQLDDQILVSPKQLQVLVRAKKPGDSVNLTFLRKGEELKAEVALGGRSRAALVAIPPSLTTAAPARR
ncbi:MAG: PDZ domain-containing protein [Verrucomicrobiales bacterium]